MYVVNIFAICLLYVNVHVCDIKFACMHTSCGGAYRHDNYVYLDFSRSTFSWKQILQTIQMKKNA